MTLNFCSIVKAKYTRIEIGIKNKLGQYIIINRDEYNG